jgi:hypothetical protein
VGDRTTGVWLFLPVPLVLWLFTHQPLGPALSLGLGVAVVLTHRLYARPWALAAADRRCLWCGGPCGAGPALELVEPAGSSRWRACSPSHLTSLGRTLGWAARHRRFVAIGVLGTLAVFLLATAATALGWLPSEAGGDAVAWLRLGVATTVLPLGWLGPSRGSLVATRLTLPFPVHIQALLGTLWVVWLFRLVGIWWLAAGTLHVLQRVA